MSSHLGLWLGGMESMPSFLGYNSTYMPTLVSAKPVKNVTLWSTIQDETITVIGHGNGIRYRWLWHVSLRPDAGVSDDRLICHHPISRPLTRSHGSKIQVSLCHVLRKDPMISYVENLTNFSNESWMPVRDRYLEPELLRDPDELRM